MLKCSGNSWDYKLWSAAVFDSSDVIGHFIDQGVYRYWINSLVDVEGNSTFYMFFVDISTGEYSVKSTYTMC